MRRVGLLYVCIVVVTLACVFEKVQCQIEAVSSFNQCVEFTDPNTGQEFDCATGVVTSVRMLVSTAQSGVDTRSFSARLTVVPNEGSDPGSQSTGTDCTSPDTETCLPTTPADITIEVGPGVYVYRLEPVEQGSTHGGVPYAHYTNIVTTPLYTNDPDLGDTVTPLLDVDDATCILLGIDSIASSTLSLNPNLASTFLDDANNKAHYRCDNTYTAIPRLDQASAAAGSITYGSGDGVPKGTMLRTYACSHTCLSGSGMCSTTVQMSVQFLPLGDTYRAWKILNPPLIAAPVTVTVSAAPTSPTTGPTVETLTVRTIATNGQAALGVTEPGGSVAVQILGTDTANGKTGPYLPGLVVTGKTGGDLLDMNDGLPGIYSRPWDSMPTNDNAQCTLVDQVQGTSTSFPYPTKVTMSPCSLSFLTGGDPMAMAYYINSTESMTVGELCQQTSPRLDTYSNLPPNALFVSPSQPAVPLRSICQETQCSSSNVCGTGEYTTDVLCTPGFGLGLGGADVNTACDVMADCRAYESMDPEDAPRFAPHNAKFFDPDNPNMWVGLDGGSGDYYLAYNQETRPIELDLLLTIGGSSVSYESEGVPNGGFVDDSVACLVGAGRVGQALYRVCNTDATGAQPANYRITVSCGLDSQFNSITQTFAAPSGAIVAPAQQFFADVVSGACATIGYGADEETGNPGARPFLIQITDPDAAFSTDDGEDEQPFRCVYQLQSDDSAVPGSVVLDTATAICNRDDATPGDPPDGFDPYDIYYINPAGTVPLNRSEARAVAISKEQAYLDQQDDPNNNAEIIVGVIVAVSVVLFVCAVLVGIVLFFVQCIQTRRLEKHQSM